MQLEYILLGILQGIFEWLPISSEGVVALFSNFFIEDLNAVDVAIFLHLGTFFAVMIYFWRDWFSLLTFKDDKLLKYLVLTTIVSAVLGFFIYDFAKGVVMGGGILFLMGVGLLLTSYFQSRKINFNIDNKYSPLVVGMLQGLSAIPGISRSGSTIFGLSFFEKDPVKILKISYLLSAPIVLGSSLYLFIKEPSMVYDGMWLSLIFAFIFGILTLKLLLDFAQKINFSKFTLIFGILCILGGVINCLI
jgi:undecaprenyl-diphosphatase